MIGDDLTPLLVPRPVPGSGFRQGTVVAFNPLTGANTISVAGGVLTDLPLLNIGDSVNIGPGDVVVLMRLRSSWAILGRVVVPGSSELARGATAVHRVNWDTAIGYALTTSLVTQITQTRVAPAWATYYQVHATAHMGALNSTGVQDFARLLLQDQAASTNQQDTPDTPAGKFTSCSASLARGGPLSGGETLTVAAQVKSFGAGWAANSANGVTLNSFWIFSRAT